MYCGPSQRAAYGALIGWLSHPISPAARDRITDTHPRKSGSRIVGSRPARASARGRYALLKENPHHPSLQLKKVGPILVGSCWRSLSRTDRRR